MSSDATCSVRFFVAVFPFFLVIYVHIFFILYAEAAQLVLKTQKYSHIVRPLGSGLMGYFTVLIFALLLVY